MGNDVRQLMKDVREQNLMIRVEGDDVGQTVFGLLQPSFNQQMAQISARMAKNQQENQATIKKNEQALVAMTKRYNQMQSVVLPVAVIGWAVALLALVTVMVTGTVGRLLTMLQVSAVYDSLWHMYVATQGWGRFGIACLFLLLSLILVGCLFGLYYGLLKLILKFSGREYD